MFFKKNTAHQPQYLIHLAHTGTSAPVGLQYPINIAISSQYYKQKFLSCCDKLPVDMGRSRRVVKGKQSTRACPSGYCRYCGEVFALRGLHRHEDICGQVSRKVEDVLFLLIFPNKSIDAVFCTITSQILGISLPTAIVELQTGQWRIP